MNTMGDFERAVDRWLDDATDATPPEVIDAVLLAARSTPQDRNYRIPWRASPSTNLAYAAAVVALIVVGLTALAALSQRFGSDPAPAAPAGPSLNLGIFEPVAGRIVYADEDGIWGVDPATPADPAASVQLTSEEVIPLGWSRDGTRLLIMRQSREGGQLFVLHADGSETQVTEPPMDVSLGVTSRGAAISPDGSRVVFTDGSALYAVHADGGPAEMLVHARFGFLEDPTFSPDGTRIAFNDGNGDNNHHVWVMNADGSDAQEIVSRDCACHVYGLAWSPAGDRIALGIEGTIYTFAPDGSEFTRVIIGGNMPYWSPDGSKIAYTVTCLEDANGCDLAIADADGSNVREFDAGASGPWHPAGGTLSDE
jgi:hypothetical protein